uniref:Inositol polyphosphate-related phosphatase domain-containing protein n=1 Tax=Brassica oleracea TaxID=3712 RepID=A0A3P6E8S0_BRAOL|nr:unnamed protein product [Brassica oleracea]
MQIHGSDPTILTDVDDNCDGSRKNVKKRYCYAELVCESLCLSRVFLATTWNVGGRTPNNDLNLEDFLLIEGRTDLCICGFQEIVPLE